MNTVNNQPLVKNEYVTGFFETWWIFSKTVLFTLLTSIKVLLVRKQEKLQFRSKIDHILKIWGQSLMRYVGAKVVVVGAENFKLFPGRAHMIMCSHTSNYDIPATFTAIDGSIRMLAKKELKKFPFFGNAMERCEMVFIDRQNRENAIKDLKEAQKVMEDGIILWVAPEGTRTIGAGKVGNLKKGGFHLAANTEAIIIPIAFRGINDLQLREKIAWHKPRTIECHIGKPIDSRNVSEAKVKNLLEAVRSSFEELVGAK